MQENALRPVSKRFPKLSKDLKTEILIIGGGITGTLCSYFLQQKGFKTSIVEMDEVGSGASGASSGILYYGTGTNLIPAINLWGKETAQFIWQETAQNIKELTQLVEKNELNCGFRRIPGIMVAKTEQEAMLLENEQRELKKIELNHSILSTNEIKEFYTGQNFLSGIHFNECSQIYPALFAAELAEKFNLPLYEYTKMQSFESSQENLIVKTSNAKIRCEKIVFATNFFPVPPEQTLGIEKNFSLESSVIIASQIVSENELKKFFPQESILWTLDENYDIIYSHENRLILEMYRMTKLKDKLKNFYPGIEFNAEKRWGSSWGKTKDWLPIAGEFQKNVFTAMAMCDQGTTVGYTTAKHSVDMIEGRKNKYLELTHPKRFNELK